MDLGLWCAQTGLHEIESPLRDAGFDVAGLAAIGADDAKVAAVLAGVVPADKVSCRPAWSPGLLRSLRVLP